MLNKNEMMDSLPGEIEGLRLFFVGIKGTGMSALAELFFNSGSEVTGSDVPEEFYTDKVLSDLGISYITSFDKDDLPADIELVIYSPAYSLSENPQLIEAAKRQIPILSYTEALGLYSSRFFSCGVTGVHGKTTTSALCGSLVKSCLLKGSVLVGSALPIFGNRATYSGGDHFFIAETCEYRRHFLHFDPSLILITNVEPDHLDYYKDQADIELAFVEYCRNLPADGTIVYCADDAGAVAVVQRAFQEGLESGRDLNLIPYGFTAMGDYRIENFRQEAGKSLFQLGLFDSYFEIQIPGKHLIQNAAGAAALLSVIAEREGLSLTDLESGMHEGFLAFSGTRRRSEIVGEADGVIVIDDYAHHPTAIDVTLAGFREFYPGRRIVVDFMSHTYSRTQALIDDFAVCFSSADKVLLNRIYASAREEKGTITGETLFNRVCENHSDVVYYADYMDGLEHLLSELKPGDVFITMGAGDNWQLGRSLLSELKKRTKKGVQK